MPRPHYAIGILAMILATILWYAPVAAHHKPGHGYSEDGNDQGKKGRKHSKQKHKNAKKYRNRYGGPPAWAPAHGYRVQHKYRAVDDGRVYEVAPADLLSLPEEGIGTCNRQILGAVLGAAVGGAVGAKFGKGDGKVLASVGGAVLGALIGGNLGRAMDQVDQGCIGQALERAPTGQTVIWDDPDRNARYDVTPTRTYRSGDGQYCREYQTRIVIGGQTEDAHGTACRQPDGSWQKSP